MRLTVDGHEFEVELNDDGAALADMAPTEIGMSRWGAEYYGALPKSLNPAGTPTDLYERGDLAYWPPGNALCILFGPTPASIGDEPRLASPGHHLGRLVGDLSVLDGLPGRVSVELS